MPMVAVDLQRSEVCERDKLPVDRISVEDRPACHEEMSLSSPES